MAIETVDFPIKNGDFPLLCEFTRGYLPHKLYIIYLSTILYHKSYIGPIVNPLIFTQLFRPFPPSPKVLMVTQQIPKLDPDQPVADQLDTLMLGFRMVSSLI